MDSIPVENQLDMEAIYKYLVYYVKSKKYWNELEKYTQLAIRHFPAKYYFDINYFDWLREKNQYERLISSYKNFFKKGGDSKEIRLAYLKDEYNGLINGFIPANENRVYFVNLQNDLQAFCNKYLFEIEGNFLMANLYKYQAKLARIKLAQPVKDFSNNYTKQIRSINAALNNSNNYFLKIIEQKPCANKEIFNQAIVQQISNYK